MKRLMLSRTHATPIQALACIVLLGAQMLLGPISPVIAAGPASAPTAQPAEPDHSGPPDSLDERFARIAERVPAFGGMFRGGDGTLFVYLTDTSEEENAIHGIEEAFGKETIGKEGVQVLEARHGIKELSKWHRELNSLLHLKGVALTDLDEAGNRVTVGVEDESALQMVKDEMESLGIPADAVNVEVTGAFEPQVTLQDKYRPA